VTEGVWLITGAQASGKSSIAELLAQRFERAVHVRGGQFYRWVVRGWVPFDGPDQDEARRLLELRYRLSAMVTDEYAAAGFVAIAQDNIYGTDVVRWLDRVRSRPRHLVVLRPSVDALEARHEHRRESRGKVAYGPTYTPTSNDLDVSTTPSHLGLWLDTSDWSPTETVDQIVERSNEAVVP
jgi:chloramphenicol 3-O-phosphotransferase